ncbi:PD-(D/E)XK motif protein [Pullulanibacillus sp. KACC 23026]|uniref:PD-(D/E)XK motif protein n=1 Tax=Pullulanibacillus sp. KACC 23026 TaxID=3028315 RepID=UPI0023AEC6B3|nr:PD-(D/E)XK motif protein [Pullulanibacillus sp. KACC 23026]WEG11147.1 PD-(D/E)XK motif protein [Pullulanibacillus sp. KACC 23026]
MNTAVINLFNRTLIKMQDENQTDMMPMIPLFYEDVIAFGGIDTVSQCRYFFIELPDGPWDKDQMMALPKWNGLMIKIEFHENFGPLKDRYFVEFIQVEPDTGDLFVTVMQNIFDYVISREIDEPLFTVIYKVLEKWRSFFKRGGYKKLNEEQQRGLYGELWFMKKWVENNLDKPPLLLEGWDGPLSDRIDFKTHGWGVEIKTVRDQLNKKIRISNENQLKITEAVPKIFIYVCYLEVSRSFGQTLQELVDELRNHFYSFSHQLLLKFNDLLVSAGFKDNEYTELYMNVIEDETYEVMDKFPLILANMLPKGISHVSYSIDLTHCEEFKIEENRIF